MSDIDNIVMLDMVMNFPFICYIVLVSQLEWEVLPQQVESYCPFETSTEFLYFV